MPVRRIQAGTIRLHSIGRVMAGLLVLLCLVAFDVSSADAHARLASSTPASGSILQDPPASYQFVFTEEVEPDFVSFTLLHSDGTQVELQPPVVDSSDAKIVTLTPENPADITADSYSIVYRVLSAVDSHTSEGAISFSIGTGEAPAGVSGDQSGLPTWWRAIGRWIEVAGWLLLIGGGLFISLQVRSIATRRSLPDEIETGWLFLLWFALGAIGVGMVLSLLGEAQSISGNLPPPFSLLKDILLETRYGLAWLVRLMLLGLIALEVISRKSIPSWRFLALVMVLLAEIPLFTFVYSGHPAAESRRVLASVSSLVHMTGAGIWIGGLPFLYVVLRGMRQDESEEAASEQVRIVKRFSWVSLLAFAAIGITGVIDAAFNVDGPRALRTQEYGQVLLVKQIFVGLALLAGAVNLLVFRPEVQRALAIDDLPDALRTLGLLRKSVAFEIIAGASILLMAAVLVLTPTAEAPMPVDVAVKGVTIDDHAEAGDVSVWLYAPLRGEPTDQFLITLTVGNGFAPDNMQKVIVESSLVSSASGITGVEQRFDAEQMEGVPGRYSFPAAQLGVEGEWKLNIIVRRAGVEDTTATFAIDTTGSTAQPPRMVSDSWHLPRPSAQTWLFIVLALVMLLAGLALLRYVKGLEPAATAFLLILILLIVGGFLITSYRRTIPVTSGHSVDNPVAYSDAVVAQGQATFNLRCAICHGADGKGAQSADPAHNHGSAANLTAKRVADQSDGDLHNTISNGLPGTQMPAHDQALSDEEIWQVVWYLRQLQAAS